MQHIAMIGCGKMGQAMVSRWLETDTLTGGLSIIKPSPPPEIIDRHANVSWKSNIIALSDEKPDCIILAVKPQMIPELLPQIVDYAPETKLYITIAAGLRIAFYEQHLPQQATIIRAMPNTPVELGKGVTTLAANDVPFNKDAITPLFSSLGLACWLDDEAQLDGATALAGSAPAYMYLFLEGLVEAGIAHGLDEQTARLLASHTMQGSAAMALHHNSHSLADLRERVTSKGGTTAAALDVLMHEDAFKRLLNVAVNAAVKRANALSG